MNKTPEPLEILRAAGWRAHDDLNFTRGGELLRYTGSLGIGGWWHMRASANVNRWARLGETLAEAVDALGLGEPRPEAMYAEYAPVMEAVR